MRSIVPTTLCLFAACTGGEPTEPLAEDLIFAAVEEDSALAVIDGESGALLRIVDASESAHGATVRYEIHNVQAAPDGAMVWMTAMPAEGMAANRCPSSSSASTPSPSRSRRASS